MADEEKKSTTNNKKKRKGKIDIPTIIFFVLMIIALVIFTILMFKKPSSRIFRKEYGDITVLVEMYNDSDEIDIAIDTKENRVLQEGTYKKKDDNTYTATFTDNQNNKSTVDVVVKDDTLTLVYDDGEEIDLKEKK